MSYDPTVDAAFVKFYPGEVFPKGSHTRERTIKLNVNIDYDLDGNILGLEILDCIQQLYSQEKDDGAH